MRVNRAGVFCILVVAVVMVLPAFAANQAATLQPVRDPLNRFTISVPTTWQVKTSTGDPAVEAKSPAPSGTLPDSVDVVVRDLPTSVTPEACVDKALGVMRFLIHDFATVRKGPEQVAGRAAYYHVYTWRTSAGTDRISYQVCVTQGVRAFMVIGTTANAPAQVQQDMPVLERITGTLRPITITTPASPQASVPEGGGTSR